MNATTKTIFSQKWNLIKPDLIKVGKGLLIALSGAAAAYLETIAGQIDFVKTFGPSIAPFAAMIFAALNSAIINALRKYATSTTYIDQQ